MAESIVLLNEKHNQKASDSYQLRPRAVVAVFPYLIREIDPQIISVNYKPAKEYSDYLNLRQKVIIIADDVLSLNISTAKGAPSHTLQATLAPLAQTQDYLQLIAPGDFIMSWIVNGSTALEDLIAKIKKLDPCNEYDSGLKFFGQVMSIQENYRIGANGLKNLRYSISASGFNQYNAQIFFSPFIVPKDATNEAGFLFPQLVFKNLGDNVVEKIYSDKNGDQPLSIHRQLQIFHQLLLGPGPGTIKNNPVKSVNGAFGVPDSVAKVFGRDVSKSGVNTFADLSSVILGVQQFSDSQESAWGPLGPKFKLADSVYDKKSNDQSSRSYGTYWEPEDDNLKLKGRKALKISPTMGGTVYSMLQQLSNSTINEMYVTLRAEPTPDARILPTFVCRQLPFIIEPIEKLNNFPYTKYFDLPRFLIPKEIVTEYGLSRNDALRLNSTMVRQDCSLSRPELQGMVDAIAIQYGNWSFDSNDIRRNGMRFYQVKVDQDLVALDDKKAKNVIRDYTAFISSIISNQHLKYTGTIQTFGIFDPICIGENLEFNDIVFHIESVNHVYQIQNGLPIFRTNFTLSHGTHKSGDLDALQEKDSRKGFESMRGGIIKESKYKTILVSSSREISQETTAENPEFA